MEIFSLPVKVEQKPLDDHLSQWLPHENRIVIADDIPEVEKVWAFVDAVQRAIYSCLHKDRSSEVSIKKFCEHSAYELTRVLVQANLVKGITRPQWNAYVYEMQQRRDEEEELFIEPGVEVDDEW